MTPQEQSGGPGPFAAPDSAARYDAHLSFVSRYGRDLIDWLQPAAGERILDLGCGTGELSAALARRGAEVLGVDRSQAMIERARAQHPELAFVVGDARGLELADGQFDAVFSNAALHWIPEARAVAAEIARLLKPGGRLVAELGARGNVRGVIQAVQEAVKDAGYALPQHPWYFPRLGEYSSLLEDVGLRVARAASFARPTPLDEDGMRAWLDVFGPSLLENVPDGETGHIMDGVLSRLQAKDAREEQWIVDYRRLRVLALKPSSQRD